MRGASWWIASAPGRLALALRSRLAAASLPLARPIPDDLRLQVEWMGSAGSDFSARLELGRSGGHYLRRCGDHLQQQPLPASPGILVAVYQWLRLHGPVAVPSAMCCQLSLLWTGGSWSCDLDRLPPGQPLSELWELVEWLRQTLLAEHLVSSSVILEQAGDGWVAVDGGPWCSTRAGSTLLPGRSLVSVQGASGGPAAVQLLEIGPRGRIGVLGSGDELEPCWLAAGLGSQVGSCTHAAGEFQIHWDPDEGQLSVSHAAAPEHRLWTTRPGQPWLAVGHGEAHITESRGSFHIRDRRGPPSTGQQITHITSEDGSVVVQGILSGAGLVRYRLSFTAVDADQLRFELELQGGLDRGETNRIELRYGADPGDRFFGFGEQFTHIDLAGRLVPILSQEQGIGRGVQPLTWLLNLAFGAGGDWHTTYIAVPHYITSSCRSLMLESTEYCEFDLRTPGEVSILIFASALAGRILRARDAAGLIEVYTRYAGRMHPPPAWLDQGAVIGMQGGTAAVDALHARLRSVDAPIAAFWLQDWVGPRKTAIGWQLWWNWELDSGTYPDWSGLLSRLGADGIEVLSYINPFLVDVSHRPGHRRNLFEEARSRGFLVREADGSPYLIPNTDFSAGLLDLTAPEVEPWLREVIQTQLLDTGVSGWMADFGEALPFDAVLADGSDPASYHNRYPVEWARIHRQAIEDAGRLGEVMFFCRSGYTTSPRHATLFWLGDQLTSWDAYDGIKSAVSGLLSSGFSGFSLNHSDIGGYTAVGIPGLPFTLPLIGFIREKELLLRWSELNAFTAVYRTHEGNQPARNHQIDGDDETLRHFAFFARIYADLAPYRRGLFEEAARCGLPVVRHPWLHYPADPQILDLAYQLMLGPDFMIAPVLDPGHTRVRVYLPADRWIHLWSGTIHEEAGWREITAPIGAPAVFYRAGSAAGEALRAALTRRGELPPEAGRAADGD